MAVTPLESSRVATTVTGYIAAPVTSPSMVSCWPTIGLAVETFADMDSSAAPAGEATTENARLAITPRTATRTRMSGSRLGRISEQRVDERLGLEGGEVVGTFAQPDQLDRDSQLALDGDDDAALGGAVELGQHDAGDVDDLSEHPRLDQAVLTRRRIEHEEHLVDRAAPLDDALDLAELVHQALLGVQPA